MLSVVCLLATVCSCFPNNGTLIGFLLPQTREHTDTHSRCGASWGGPAVTFVTFVTY